VTTHFFRNVLEILLTRLLSRNKIAGLPGTPLGAGNLPDPNELDYWKLAHYPVGAIILAGIGSRPWLGGGGRKDQLRGFDRATQEKTWRRCGGGRRRGLENRGLDSNNQSMREIDSPISFEAASGTIQHEIGDRSLCFGCGTFPAPMRTDPMRHRDCPPETRRRDWNREARHSAHSTFPALASS